VDEPIRSIWTQTARRTPAGALTGEHRADVVVVGGGVAGLSVAVRLAERGARVIVLERNRIARGVTAGSTAKVTALHGRIYTVLHERHGAEVAAAYAEANMAGVDDVRTAVERHGIDCAFTAAPAVTYAGSTAGAADVEAEHEAAAAAGLPVTRSDETDLPFPVRGAVVLADQAHLDPVRYCQGLADALPADAIFEGTTVVDVEEDRGGCRAITTHGNVRADHAVIATQGPIVDPRYLTARCRPERSYALAAPIDAARPGSGNELAPTGMYLSVDAPTRSVRPATVDGTRYLIVGGEGHPVGDESDARACLDALEAWALEHLPVGAVAARWAAHDPVSSDHIPFIGRLTGRSKRWVATGFAKWGFSTSMVAASIVADGVDGIPNSFASVFDATRMHSTVNAELGRSIARVAARYGGDQVRVRSPGHRWPDGSIAPGDGRVLRTRKGPAAVYRDEADALHAVSATCTHQGCLVRFNRAQTSWDCPCHGSRFDPDGHVLCGPAVEDLAPITLDRDSDEGHGDVAAGGGR
jgi:glycine/D-amino acid oxidase-like deaminating enzyme/nitrite reductase/ring-hydroxylating ferredoxin subunit